jgi:hypothetical protein
MSELPDKYRALLDFNAALACAQLEQIPRC